MKSRLFSAYFDPETESNKDLKGHLALFLGLSDEHKAPCLGALERTVLAATPDAEHLVMDELEASTRRPLLELSSVVSVLEFFLKRMIDDKTKQDTTHEWAQDLVECRFLSSPEVQPFVTWIERVRSDVLPHVESHIKRRTYTSGVFPSLRSFGATVELRAVQADKYAWGTPLEQYRPRILDVAAVASIHIGVDAGAQRDFFFQATESELQLLIDSLIAAKQDLQALRGAVTFSEEGVSDKNAST